MFQALKPLLDQCKALDLKLVATEGGITVLVIPTPKDGQADAALKQPFKLSGTVEELDQSFLDALQRLAGGRSSLVESIEAAEAIIAAHKKSADDKAVKALKGPKASPTQTPKKPATAPDPDADDDTDDDTPASAAAPAAATGAGVPAAQTSEDNLFSL